MSHKPADGFGDAKFPFSLDDRLDPFANQRDELRTMPLVGRAILDAIDAIGRVELHGRVRFRKDQCAF